MSRAVADRGSLQPGLIATQHRTLRVDVDLDVDGTSVVEGPEHVLPKAVITNLK